MSEESDASEEQSFWSISQKPLPLLRILKENGQGGRIKSPGKPSPTTPHPVFEKENIQVFTKLADKRLISISSTCSISKDLGDSSEYASQDAMSSTWAVQQSTLSTPERLKPSLFSASNLSSISLLVNTSNVNNSPQDHKFKTPKRKDEILPVNDASTPSSGSSKKSSKGTRTPSSGCSGFSSGSGIRYNPFDSHFLADRLHLPTLSPSVFATINSPSNEESVNGQFWSIEQQAELYPTAISDDSPFKQSILYKNYRHDSDSKAQEQIELYFSNYHDVTSPPDLPPTGPLLTDSPEVDNSYIQTVDTGKSSKWTQTCISLPPVLPPQVESILRQYNLITEISEEPNNLSNSTLRRKLFNAEIFGDADESQGQSTSSDDDEDSSPLKIMTPGKIIRTPVTSKPGNTAQWSSSPLRTRHRTSISPPDMNSPMFSPIAKGRTSDRSGSICSVGGDDYEINDCSVIEREVSELYETAEIQDVTEMSCINMDTDSNSGSTANWRNLPSYSESTRAAPAWGHSARIIEDSSTAASGLTLPTQGEDSNMNTESRIDTGYTTNTVSSIHPSGFQDSVQPSGLDADSGVSTSQQPDLTVSMILPQPLIQPQNQVLMSYAVEGTNDISVGFPLGSSTPTKR